MISEKLTMVPAETTVTEVSSKFFAYGNILAQAFEWIKTPIETLMAFQKRYL